MLVFVLPSLETVQQNFYFHEGSCQMEVQDCCEGQISKTWFVNLMWIKISYLTLLFNGCNWCRVSNGSPLGKWISELKYIFFFLYKNVTSGIVLSVWTSHICDMGLECLSVNNVQHIILHFLPASEDFSLSTDPCVLLLLSSRFSREKEKETIVTEA